MKKVAKTENTHRSGKRKRAVARATISTGTGLVRVNNVVLENHNPNLAKLKIMEPIILAGTKMGTINIDVQVMGGGYMSQAEAARTAISRALIDRYSDLKTDFLNYDRTLLVADTRRKESSKPNCHGRARAKVQKSYR